VRRIATAAALAVAIFAGPLALARCAVACEQSVAHTALQAPPCHHHTHHATGSALVAPTGAIVIIAIGPPADTLPLAGTAPTLTFDRLATPPRSFARPLRI
jgi:hypothetical protein